MLKRLRTKFIVLNMAMVATVLVAALAAICFISFQQDVNDVYKELDSSIDRSAQEARLQTPIESASSFDDGALPSFGDDPSAEGPSDDGQASGESESGVPPEIGGRKEKGSIIPIVVCTVEDDGSLAIVSSATTATISSDVLDEAAQAVFGLKDGHGELKDLGLLYSMRSTDAGTVVAFADEASVSDWQTLALTLAVIGIATLAVLFAIAVFFSRWAFRPVEETWRKQRQFVADASHELKTPLTVILANSSIIRKHPERSVASQSQWIRSTQQEAERMQELVEDMLTLARLDADDEKTALSEVDLSELMEGEVLQFESVAYENSIEIISDIDQNVFVQGDEKRLGRLMAILLDNACKYADEGGMATVSLHARTKEVTLRVSNTGSTIPKEDLERVFDRFFRVDKARTREIGGFGLGLAIAREIVDDHKGSIAAESDKGTTTFTVKLPLR